MKKSGSSSGAQNFLIAYLHRLLSSKAIIILYGFFLFLYIIIRAHSISFGFDEVVSYQIMDQLSLESMGKHSNNHFLNTVLMNLSSGWLGNSELALRLPNVFAFLLYLIFVIKTAFLINKRNSYLIILLLTATPFLLDFFSLARGYGLALSFMMMSVYFILNFIKNSKHSYVLISILAGMLAVLSNYIFLIYFLSLIPVIILSLFLDCRAFKIKLRHGFFYLVPVALFLMWILPVLFELKRSKQLFYGGRSGFIIDTIGSLGRCLAYFNVNILTVQILFGILFIVAVGISIYRIYGLTKSKIIGFGIAESFP